MKPVLQVFAGWLLGLVLAFLIFCLGGAVWDACTAPHPVNAMVGHAPGGITFGGFALLCWLIPCFGPLCLLAVFAVLLIAVIAGDALLRR
ncbi:hypothetical protein [Verrucomicrobium sp. BvORR106]|uniref:hypothetical protein n=1 Tax=Verrucomicrobium sp. BvORR106 TaxID=1403819 RepID=UPI00056F150F|nr:hypothetical protein [Verrucomicrobium sp. BvORR106]